MIICLLPWRVGLGLLFAQPTKSKLNQSWLLVSIQSTISKWQILVFESLKHKLTKSQNLNIIKLFGNTNHKVQT